MTICLFQEDAFIDLGAVRKGKGCQGVMNRHGFAGGKATHVSMSHRAPGAIGASAWPSRVFKGTRMSGRMGNRRVTAKNLQIVRIDRENGRIYVRGSVPGSRSGYVFVKSARKG